MTSRKVAELTLVPFREGHLDFMEIRPHERDLLDPAKFAVLAADGMCATAAVNGHILGVFGFTQRWQGVIEVFIVPTVWVPKYAKTFVKLCRNYLTRLEKDIPDLHRIETQSIAEPHTDKYMEILGFTCEGTHVQFTANKVDYRTWARLVTK